MRIVLLLLFSMFICACDESPSDSVVFGLDNMPNNLDPRHATDAVSYRINRLIYSSIVDFDESARFVPGIASWQLLSPTQYRFTINGEHIFHNGDRLTAEDIKATYDSVLDEKQKSPHRSSVALIDEIKVIDNNTVDFILKYADPFFPGYLIIGILPKQLIDNNFDFTANPVGSGAFRYSGWGGVESLTLERIKDGQKFDFIRVVAPEVRAMKLIRGEIDILQNGLMPELVRYLRKQASVKVEDFSGTDFAYIGFNMQDEKLSNLKIRQAIAYSIDRDAILKYLFGGEEKKATAFFPADHWLGNHELIPYEYSPQKAQKILAGLGYSKQNPLLLSYKTSTNSFRLRVAAILQQQMKESWINIDIQSYDWGTFYGDIKKGNFQMYSLKWVGIKSPDIFEYVFHSKSVPRDESSKEKGNNGANRGRYNNPEVDRLIEKAKHESGLEESIAIYRKIEQLVFEDLPYVPLWYEGNFFATSNRISGYYLSPGGNFDGLINVQRKE